jgi:Fe-S cluster assembly iron-binding protein IscA
MRRLFAMAVLALAGCSPPPAPVAVPVTPKPVVEISPRAEKVLRQIAVDQKVAEPWWVRLSVTWHPDPFIEVHLDRKPPGPDDFETAASGLKVVLARNLLTYLRGSRVEFVETPERAGFDVTFPNQDVDEREAAGKWLKEETAKHKGAGNPKGQ